MATSKRINVDSLPDLSSGNSSPKTINVDDLPEVKKKVGSSNNGTNGIGGFSTQQSANGFDNLKNALSGVHVQPEANPNASLGVDTGMKPVDTEAIKVQEQKTAKKAAINTAHRYFDNNKVLLELNAKLNPDLSEKDEDGKPIDGKYDEAALEKSQFFNTKVNEILKNYQGGNLALSKFQNGKKVGEPVFTRPAGFFGSIANSIANSFKSTKEGIQTMDMNAKELADFYDKQKRFLPEVPESEPTGVGSMVGGALGGMIKPIAEFAAGEAAVPEGGGLATMAMDVIPTTTNAKMKELYYQKMNELEGKYGNGKVPESERIDAAQKAINTAPLQAIPDEALQLYLFKDGGGSLANKSALQSFQNTVTHAGKKVADMAILGDLSAASSKGIKELQGYNTGNDNSVENTALNYALMEGAFKVIAVGKAAVGKYVLPQAKEALTTVSPEVTQAMANELVQKGEITPEQADQTLNDLQSYSKIRSKLPEDMPSDKAASITGLVEKNETLEKQKQNTHPILHDNINAEIKANEQKAKDILNSSQPLKHETDQLTGQRGQDIGGRPTIEETEAKAETLPASENNENGNSENGRIASNEGGTNKENVGETLQPQQTEENGITVIKPEENIPNDNVTEVHSTENPKTNSVVEDKGEPQNQRISETDTKNISQPLNTEQGGGKEKALDDLADVHVEYPPTQLTHGGTERLRGEFGGEDAPKKERESFLETERQANEAIENGYDVNGLLDKMEKENHNPSPKEQFILTKQAGLLANQLRDIGKSKGINSPEFDAKLNELDRLNTLSDLAGSRQGKELVSRKFRTINDDSLVGFLLQEKDLNKGADLTEGQKTTAINEYEKINEANDEFQKKYEDLQAKYNKLLAERELKKTHASTAKNIKKTHEDFVKERTGIVKDIREKLKKAREETSVTVVPYAKELIAIAPDVAKLAKSLIEEGVNKLDDVVKNIHAQLKEDVPNLEEKDVHDIIAGVYNEKKKTRSQVAEQMQNLKIQAQLISKYENLLKGSEPKNEKAKIKRNQEIHDLRGKIAGFKAEEREAIADKKATERAEEKEANTFYGESETGNKRIEKMEDELQRLKERKPKETSPKQQREISDREKELKEQIIAERKTIAAEEKEANTRYTENVPDEIKKLNAIKTRNENELEKINQQLKTGDFEPPKKKTPLSQDDELKKNFPQAYKETLTSQTKLIKARQERQIRMARQQFDNMTKRQKFAKNLVRYLNVPRTLMASWDFSAPLRQGAVVTAAHPRMAAKSFATMFKHAFSQEKFDQYYHELKESPKWRLYEDSKLAITDPHDLHLNKQEEAYLGGNVAERIPLIGKGVKASERAYVSYLNKMRIDLFDRYVDLFEEQGKTFSNSPDLYKGLATYINNATGRGSLGFADAAAPVLNSVLFSPRLIASRMNMLGIPDLLTFGHKGFYTALPKEVRVMAMKDMLKFIGAGMSVLALAKYGFGAQVEDDPRSSDFGKIRSGNTRWDLWGGFQPYVRVIAQIATGQRKTDALGVNDIDKRFGENRLTPFWSFARGKLAPIPSMGIDVVGGGTLVGQRIERRFDIPFDKSDNPKGNDITLTDEAVNHLLPLLGTDIYDAMKDRGISSLFTVGIPSTFGVGTQTYQERPTKSSKTNRTQVRQTPKRQVIQHR